MEGKVFQISLHKANDYYECYICKGIIFKNETYKRVKYFHGSTIKTLKIHEKCEVPKNVTF